MAPPIVSPPAPPSLALLKSAVERNEEDEGLSMVTPLGPGLSAGEESEKKHHCGTTWVYFGYLF